MEYSSLPALNCCASCLTLETQCFLPHRELHPLVNTGIFFVKHSAVFEDKRLLYKMYSVGNVFVWRETTQLEIQSFVCTALLHSFGCFQAFLISSSFSWHKFLNTYLDLFACLLLTKRISTVQSCEALEISNTAEIKLNQQIFFY